MNRILIILLLFIAGVANGQLMQVNNTPGGYQWKAGKDDSLTIIPRGVDTPNIGNNKFGVPTVGALFVQTIGSDSAVMWQRTQTKWIKVATSAGGSFVPLTRTININGVTQDLSADRQWRAGLSNTGALTYGGITVAGATTVNIGAVTGIITDNETNPAVPSYQVVSYAGGTNITVPTIATGTGTYVLLNNAGALVFQNTFPTSAQRKSMIYLSKISHPNLSSISFALDEVDFVNSPLQQFRDLFQFIQYMKTGIVATGNAGLTINTSNGEILGNGINFVTSRTTPNNVSIPPGAPLSFLLVNQSGAAGSFTTTIDPANYDVGGVTTPIGGGTNNSTIQYLYYAPGVGFAIQRGQTVYANLTDAIAAVGRESFTVRANLVNNSILIAAIVLRHTTTDMSDPAFARILTADKFGQIGGAASGISVTSLQTAYNNSTVPQIVTDATRDGVTIRRGSAADTDSLFKLQNGAGVNTLGVLANGSTSIANTATNGLAMYNTADQTTNYQRVRQFWSGNIFNISTENSGAVSASSVRIGTPFSSINISQDVNQSGVFNFNKQTSAATGSIIGVQNTSASSSGFVKAFSGLSHIFQSGSAGYKIFYASPYEEQLGSGQKLLMDLGTNSSSNDGGTHTSKFAVSNTGATSIGSGTVATSSIFDVVTTTLGSRPFPLQTSAQWNAVASKTSGLYAFDTDRKHDVFWDGSVTSWFAKVTTGTAAPATTPTSIGQLFINTTNGAKYISVGVGGSVDWSLLSGGVAGSSGQIQYNQSGAFTASPNLTWDNSQTVLFIAQSATTGQAGITLSNNIGAIGAIRGYGSAYPLTDYANAVSISSNNNYIIAASFGVQNNGTNRISIRPGGWGEEFLRVKRNGLKIASGNTTDADASAIVDISSTTQGLLLPRMTAAQGSAISTPADGLMIYVTSTDATFTSVGFWGRLNGTWTALHL